MHGISGLILTDPFSSAVKNPKVAHTRTVIVWLRSVQAIGLMGWGRAVATPGGFTSSSVYFV